MKGRQGHSNGCSLGAWVHFSAGVNNSLPMKRASMTGENNREKWRQGVTDDLPVIPVIPEVGRALSAGTGAVLIAPPGAGKTTCVPLALLGAPWLAGRKIVMLEPRRLAARAAARRMAGMLDEQVGETVGYRVRLESRVGASTRIEVVTEGILTRWIQRDPELSGVGLVIFDEFHERSLQADLGLAFCLESRGALREDLRILVMSATLAGEPVARLIGDASVIASLGRSFPVETRYIPQAAGPWAQGRHIVGSVADAVMRAVGEEAGSVLVFLPGAGEIRRVTQLLDERLAGAGIAVAPLYGNLHPAEQDRAIRPAPSGKRKIVLATSIAETSLTIEGIRVVVDCGWMRVPRFSPGTGMSRLETVRVSKASADQRRGRAGRLEPGICYRLWSEAEHRGLMAQSAPEILSADLAPLALELAVWGVSEPDGMAWLDPPPEAAFLSARDLLLQLGALDRGGRVTAHGKAMAGLGLHPRLAHMLLAGRRMGRQRLACELAGILGERDILQFPPGAGDADIRLRVEALREGRAFRAAGASVNSGACRRIREQAARWKSLLKDAGGKKCADGGEDPDRDAGTLLAMAYPDRVAQLRPEGVLRYRLSGGRGARFIDVEPLSAEALLVAAELDGAGRDARIRLAAPVRPEDLAAHLPERFSEAVVVRWDPRAAAVEARFEERFGELVLHHRPLGKPEPARVAEAMLEGIRQVGLSALPWDRRLANWRARVMFLRGEAAGGLPWPDLSDEALLARLDAWLLPFLGGITRRSQLQRLNLKGALLSMISWEQQKALDTLAPTHVVVPSGSRIPVDYAAGDVPVLAVRLQEMFGSIDTPRIAGGRVPLLLHLLSPAGRPLQVTRDLAGFWTGSYVQVKKEMKGRYPKHYWPDDPLAAMPTNRAKPRGKR